MSPIRPELTVRNFPSAEEEAALLKPTSRYDGADSSYRLAFADERFLLREDLRPVRMQLELLKPELILREENILATVVIFGSARCCRTTWRSSGWRRPRPAATPRPRRARAWRCRCRSTTRRRASSRA
jgi:hypothetical protein